MKKIFTILTLMLFSALSLHAFSDEEIKTLLQENSSVEIISVENDDTKPWTMTDNKLSVKSSNKYLKITFTSDCTSKLKISGYYNVTIYLDDYQSNSASALKNGLYMSAGTHVLSIKSTSSNSYVTGLTINKVDSTDDDVKRMIEANSDIEVEIIPNDTMSYAAVGQDSLVIPYKGNELSFTFDTDLVTKFDYNTKSYVDCFLDGVSKSKGNYITSGKHTITLKSTATSINSNCYIKGFSLAKVSDDSDIKTMLEKTPDLNIVEITNSAYPFLLKNTDSLYSTSSNCELSIVYETDWITKLSYANAKTSYTVFYVDGQQKVLNNYLPSGRHTLKIKGTGSGVLVEGLQLNNVCKDSDIEKFIKAKSEVDVEIENDTISPWVLTDGILKNNKNDATLSISFESEYKTLFRYNSTNYNLYIDGKSYSTSTGLINAVLQAGNHTLKFVCRGSSTLKDISIREIKDSDIEAMIEANSDIEILEIKNDSLYPCVAIGQDSIYNPNAYKSSLSIVFETDHITQFNYTYTFDYFYLDNERISNGAYIPLGKHTLRIDCSAKSYIRGLSIKKVFEDSDIKEMIEKFSDVEVEIVNDTLYPWVSVGQDSLYNPYSNIGTLSVTFETDYITQLNYDEAKTRIYLDNNSKQISKGRYIPSGRHTLIIQWSEAYVRSLSIKNVCKDSDIEEMIETNSDVDVEIVNDSVYPWTPKGQDSLYCTMTSSTSSNYSYLSVTFETEYITKFSYNAGNSNAFYIDDREISKDTYLPSGKHTLKIKAYSSGRYVRGLSIKNVCKDSDIEEMIETNSDVEVEIVNDSVRPWFISGQDTLYNEESDYDKIFTISYKSDSISCFSLYGAYKILIDDTETLSNGEPSRKLSLYLNPGEHSVTLLGSSRMYRDISIKNICKDSDIKAMIEANSDVEVQVTNDILHPWIIMGQDSIVCNTKYLNGITEKPVINITYTSEKATTISFKASGYVEYTIDGLTFDKSYAYLNPGTHTIQFTHNNAEHYTRSVITSLSINEVKAMVPIKTDFSYPTDNTAYYDTDGDGTYEWISWERIYAVDWSNLKSYKWKDYYISSNKYDLYPNAGWYNLNNDEYLDGVFKDDGHTNSVYYSYDSIVFADSAYNFKGICYNPLSRSIPLDYNNDGYPDLVSYENENDNDLSFTLRDDRVEQNSIRVLSLREYQADTIVKKHGGGPVCQSMETALYSGLGVVSPSPKKPYFSMPLTNMDFNGDGMEDYYKKMNGSMSEVFLNMGDGTVVYQDMGGDYADLNGDGVMDFITFSNPNVLMYIWQNDGSYISQSVYASAPYSNLWCYDLDKDNDKDLLLVFNYTESLGGSYLILLENIGEGVYNNYEYFYYEKLEFGYCVDFDSDGKYELISRDGSQEDEDGLAPVCYLEIDGMSVSENITYLDIRADITESYGGAGYYVTDIDNDGVMELSVDHNTSSSSGNNALMLLSDVANEKPYQSKAPTFAYEPSSGNLSITWGPGTDKESSSVDLTYALRIGTEPGKGDIVYAHALADGTRRNCMGGNQGNNRFRLLNTNTWKAGKYYISVQAVDPNNRGSLFSEEVVFEKTTHANAFELSYTTPFGIGDTCTVNLHPNVLLDESHYLSFEDAVIIDKSDDGLTYRLVFSEAGDKLISLYSDNENGAATKVSERYITVEMFSTYKTEDIANVAFDMDEDGYMEYFVYDKLTGGVANSSFMSYDADGNISKINKMWNNHANVKDGTESFILDINNDGKADAINHVATEWYGGGTSWSILLNTGNKNMQVVADNYLYYEDGAGPNDIFMDFNNDGYLDIWYTLTGYKYILANAGDYINYYSEYIGENIYVVDFRDLTNDGLVDMLVDQYSYDDSYRYHNYAVYENNGDFSFMQTDTIYSCSYKKDDGSYSLCFFEDLDNDGALDMVYKHDKKYYIDWSDGSATYLNGIANIENETLLDVNNDGYLDIPASGGLNDDNGVLLILPNHSYKFVENVAYPDYVPFVTPDGNLRSGNVIIRSDNTRPSAPTNITAGHSAKGVMLSWEHSQDAETPSVRMRYNISVKRKGQTGEGAYLISPCNSTKNGVHVPTTQLLIEGNHFLIPTASIPPGEYEVQVQGVDLHYLESDFSEVFNLVVGETIAIEAPSTTGVGVETEIKFASNVGADVNWDGGFVVSSAGNRYNVVWQDAGIKNITAGGYSQVINVVPSPDASFNTPSEVMANATVNVTADNARLGKWSVSRDGKTFTDFNESDVVKIISTDNDKVVISFLEEGRYIIRRTVAGEYGDGVCEQTVLVTDGITPEILTVTNSNGHYQIIWNHSVVLPEDVTGVRIYKETSYIDVYDMIYESCLDENIYVDMSSTPDVKSSRYAMSYVTSYGESPKGTPHQGIHIMINKGVGNTWNLAWMKYEGRKISQYRIWRGTDPENMSVIGEISGNMTSYSDMMTDDAVNYYAVEVVFAEGGNQRNSRTSSSTNSSMSNVVSTTSYNEVSFVESIDVQGQDIVANTGKTSQLIAYINPYYATYKGVNWVVEEGDDIATIDANGVLKANGVTNGNVLVRAYALDGSEVYGEKTIKVSGFNDNFTITYVLDGEVYQTKTVKYKSEIIPINAPYKEGYTFNGWQNLPETMPSKNITVYGDYSINYYTLTYMLDGELYASDTIMYGAAITLLPELTKEGHTFSGWQNAPSTMPANDVTIYGSFAINSYDLIYIVDGVEYKRYTLEFSSTIIPEADAIKEGYDFSGWSEIPETMPAHDVEVTGSFSINTYLVTYIVEKEVYATDSVVYNAEIVTPEGPSREGYTFAWNDIPSTMPANDITIYGSFTINSYDLIYIVDGEEYKRYTLEFGATITPEEEPVKEGHTFSGWSEIPETMPAHDVEVTGSFTVGIDELDYDNSDNVRKIFYDNQVYIIRDGRLFNVYGMEIKDYDIKEKLGIIE